MNPSRDLPGESTCTTCSFSEDFSNYWTAVLYFRARNGTFKRVPQMSQISGAQGGITVYYMQDALYDTAQKSKVKSFKPVSQKIGLMTSCSLTIPSGLPHVHRRCQRTQKRGRPQIPTADLHLHGELRDTSTRDTWYVRLAPFHPELGFDMDTGTNTHTKACRPSPVPSGSWSTRGSRHAGTG